MTGSWPRTRLKNLVEPVQNGIWGADPAGDDDDILCIRVADFHRKRFGLKAVETLRSVPEKDRAARLLRAGDILLEKSGGTELNPVGFTVMFDGGYPAVTSNFIGRVRMRDGQNPKFWLYALAASYLTRRTQKCVRQTTGIQNLDQGAYLDEVFPVPPLDEQCAIADYLDRETALIDTLIEEQQRLIVMQQERRAAVISHATLDVTDVRVPLRRVVDVIDCAHVTAEFVDADKRFPVASIRECRGPVVDLSDCRYTTKEFFEHLRASDRAPRDGDLLFIRNVSVGLVSVVAPGMPDFAIGQETVLLRRTSAVDPAYLRYILVGSEAQHAIESALIGSTFRRINVAAIRGLPVALPSVDEQQRIAAHLDDQTAKIDQVIVETERFIELSNERRSALITAAVTGQINVRKVA